MQFRQELTMLPHAPRKPHSTPVQEPDDSDPGLPPVAPEDGLVPPAIPDDPEHDRMIDPED